MRKKVGLGASAMLVMTLMIAIFAGMFTPAPASASVTLTTERSEADVPRNITPSASFSPVWPCSSAYSVTCMYYYKDGSKHSTRYGYTKGLDITGGGNILAVEAGTVETATNLGNKSFGKYVVIRHDNGVKTLYGHLSSYNVSVGNSVKKGQKIGVMGSTGNSTGTHLHFEMSNCDPFMTYYKDTYREKIRFESNVRSNNNKYNSDKSIVRWIDQNYKYSNGWYVYKGSSFPTSTFTPCLLNNSNIWYVLGSELDEEMIISTQIGSTTNIRLIHRKFDKPRTTLESSRMVLRLFKFQKNSDGSYSIVSYGGKALSLYGTNGIRLENLNSSNANQKWALMKAPSGYTTDSFMLMNANKQYLEVPNSNAKENASLRLAAGNNAKRQVFRLYPINSSTMYNLIVNYDRYTPSAVHSKYDENGKGFFIVPCIDTQKFIGPTGDGYTCPQPRVDLPAPPAEPRASTISKRRMFGFQFVKNDTGYSIINMGTGKAMGVDRASGYIILKPRSSYDPIWQVYKSNVEKYKRLNYVHLISPRGGFFRSGTQSYIENSLHKLEPYDPKYDAMRAVGLLSVSSLEEIDKPLDPVAVAASVVDSEGQRKQAEMLAVLDDVYSGIMLDASIAAANGDTEAQKVLNDLLSGIEDTKNTIKAGPASVLDELKMIGGREFSNDGDGRLYSVAVPGLGIMSAAAVDEQEPELESELEIEVDEPEPESENPEEDPDALIESSEPESGSESEKSGGCDAGFGVLALAGVVIFIKRKSK